MLDLSSAEQADPGGLWRLGSGEGGLPLLWQPRVSEHSVLAGHFAATAARVAANEGPILILQDTIEFIYSRAQPGKIGFTKIINAGRYKSGQPNVLTFCGELMRSSLAVNLTAHPSV
ncbi:hypothetical protein NKG99_31605 [Mesorhizobium sp. M1409]|uniref:hypothetical protein n=1 Tax=unclassified Mesorhizobium TaxID=325217 RepID=UPI0033384303